MPDTLTPRERRFTVALFLMGLAMYFIVNFHRVAIPGQIFSQLQSELRVSASAIAGLGTSFMYIYAVTQLLVGVLVDRYGGMRVLALGGVVLSLGTVLFACATSFWMLFASRALIGLGCGCAYLSMVKECARLYPHRFTSVLGFVIFWGFCGGIAGTYPFVRGVAAFGWRAAMLAIAGVTLLIMVGLALVWRGARRPAVNHAALLSATPYRDGLTNHNTLKCLFASMTGFGVYYVVLTVIGNKLLEDVGGLRAPTAALCSSLLVFLSAVSNQVTGLMSARRGNRRRQFLLWQAGLVPVGCLLAIIGLASLPGRPALGPVLVAAFLCIMMSSGFSPLTNAILIEVNPPALTGVAVGLGNFTAYAFVALFSSLAGAILDLFGGQAPPGADGRILYPAAAYQTLFAIFLVFSTAAYAVARRLPETHGRNIHDGRPHPVRLFGHTLFSLHT
jgi:MFS family permease